MNTRQLLKNSYIWKKAFRYFRRFLKRYSILGKNCKGDIFRLYRSYDVHQRVTRRNAVCVDGGGNRDIFKNFSRK